MADPERDLLERTVAAVSDQAEKADAVVEGASAGGLPPDHPLTRQAKILRHEILQLKADLEAELGLLVLDCRECGGTVHWVAGAGSAPGHWAHREPAPHGDPVV
jgi:hypothetical protein